MPAGRVKSGRTSEGPVTVVVIGPVFCAEATESPLNPRAADAANEPWLPASILSSLLSREGSPAIGLFNDWLPGLPARFNSLARLRPVTELRDDLTPSGKVGRPPADKIAPHSIIAMQNAVS